MLDDHGAGKTVLITGGTDVVGSYLTTRLINNKFNVIILTTEKAKYFNLVQRQAKLISKLDEIVGKIDIVINLAGVPFEQSRWTYGTRQQLVNSRINTTKALVQFFNEEIAPPALLINASAIWYYGDNKEECIEVTEPGTSFSSKLCQAWEAEAKEALRTWNARLCLLRIGTVLAPNDGLIAKMLPRFNAGFGGKTGNGEQIISWIHIDDLINIIMKCIQDTKMHGAINCVSPHYTTNKDFVSVLGKYLQKPTFFTIPKFLMQLWYGQMSDETIFNAPAVISERLKQVAFKYEHPRLELAIANIVKRLG